MIDKAQAEQLLEKYTNDKGQIMYGRLSPEDKQIVSACLCVLAGKCVISAGGVFYCVE